MPSLQDATKSAENLSTNENYTPVDSAQRPAAVAPSSDLQPGYSVFLRCPLPPIWNTSVDSLRQFYSGQVPQTRLFNPPAPVLNGGNNTIVSSGGTVINNTGGGSTSPTTSSILTAQASIVTPSIAPLASFTGIIKLSKCFQLVMVSSNMAARVELYGTAQAQAADSYRGVDVPPPAGSTMNIISDLALDTAPFQWTYQDRDGNNGDVPASSNVYITITNLSAASSPITVTITYAPLVT